MTEKFINVLDAKKIWRSGNEYPTEGDWQYVLKVVTCTECYDQAHFQFAYFKDGKWRNWSSSDAVEVGVWKVASWMNIELFEAYGFKFDFTR